MTMMHRLGALVSRAKIGAAIVRGRTLLQVSVLANENFDAVELLLPPGYVARPLPTNTADPLVIEIGAYGSHKVAIGGDDTADAVPDLQGGESGLSRGGKRIILRLSHIELVSPLLQWMSVPGNPLYRLVQEEFMPLFNGHTHAGGAVPDQQMTSAHLTGGS